VAFLRRPVVAKPTPTPEPEESPPPPVHEPPLDEWAAHAMIASTANVPLANAGAWATWKYGNRDWQIEAWRLFDVVGELRFLSAWIGDSVSQARLYVARINDNGEEEGEVTDSKIARLAAIPLGSGSQRDDNLRLMGIDLAIAGEAWVVGEGVLTEKPKSWFVLTSGQIRRVGEVTMVNRPMSVGGGILELKDGNDVLIRSWRPHPNDIAQSDSPTRSAIPPLREIELLTKREFAELESRLVGAGILPIPEGWDFPRSEGDPEGMDGLTAVLQRAAATNIKEQSLASALVPIIVTIPDSSLEHLDKIKPITFWSDLSDQIVTLKEKAILRLGATFEVPSEILTGMGDSNHWTSWAISEEGIKRIKPYLATIADTLTRGFLHPLLKLQGVEDVESYTYAFDVAPLSVRPNRLPEAIELNDRGLLSNEETVKAGAFTKEQMPSDRERLTNIIYKAILQNPAMIADPGVQAVLGIVLNLAPPAEEAPAIEAPPAEEDNEATPDTLDDGPADGETPGPDTAAILDGLIASAEAAEREARQRDGFTLACELLVVRALEKAGTRAGGTKVRGHRYRDTPTHELHVRLGPLREESLQRALEGAWAHVDTVADEYAVCPDVLRDGLDAYTRDLLTHGVAHSRDLLAVSLRSVPV
jgi:hypothetical protein